VIVVVCCGTVEDVIDKHMYIYVGVCTVIKAALEEFASVLDDGDQKQQIERYLQDI
jgi:hypothetical protein